MVGAETDGRIGPGAAEQPFEVCVFRPTLGQGGADRVTITLLRFLERRRFRLRLVLSRACGELLAEVPDDVPIGDLGGHRLWTAWWPLARLLRRRPPTALLSTSSGANITAVIAHVLCGQRIRLVLSERSALGRTDRSRLTRLLQLLLKRWLYPRADCVTAVSRGVADELVEKLGLPRRRVRVVYNPVVSPEIASAASAEVPHPWFRDRQPILLAAGRLVSVKRLDRVIELLPLLGGKEPPRLVLLGDGAERSTLTRLTRRLGVEDRVWFAGFDANPFRYMARCTVFVLTSDYEGLPGALIQAMACGAAVVATDCPHGPSEIVEDGVNGLLVPPGDSDALLAGIERLLDDPSLRRRLGERARVAVGRFSVSAALGGYAEALLGQSEEELDPQ